MESPKQSPRPETRIRLQKYLASCGSGSRRFCERLISEGRVTVDGRAVIAQGVCIDPSVQAVCVDGESLVPQGKIFLALNKPRGFICTSRDPRGRRTAADLLPAFPARIFTIGRLDMDSEGLILFTNDGGLAHLLMHPRHGIEKTYLVWASAELDAVRLKKMRAGVMSRGELLRLNGIERADGVPGTGPVYRLRLSAGKNRHVRRMFESLGMSVLRLRRIAIGCLKLGGLRPGEWRRISGSEIRAIRSFAEKRMKQSS